MLESATEFSVDWWKGRSLKELRDMSNSGLSGNGVCEAAASELERRAVEASHLQRQLAQEAVSERNKRRFWINAIASSLVVLIAAVSIVLWWFVT